MSEYCGGSDWAYGIFETDGKEKEKGTEKPRGGTYGGDGTEDAREKRNGKNDVSFAGSQNT